MMELNGEPLDDAQRRPLIDDAGRHLLNHLLEHAHAPRYNHTCGDRLTAEGLQAVRAFESLVRTTPPPDGRRPGWVDPFARAVGRTVPAYRARVADGIPFEQVPTTDRHDLVSEPWAFVPDDHPLDEMVVYTTTGTTTGRVAYVASTPATATSYLVMLRAALATRGLELRGGPGRVVVAQVCWQRSTYTYASVSTFLGQGGILKLNLNPAEWRDPTHVAAFLDAVDPEVVTGDPVAFAHLADLPIRSRPTALLSSAMALTDGLATRLEERFDCPVIDVYGMNEAGPIAASLPDRSGHELLQPRLHVEILDEAGVVMPPGDGGPGARGEITLTGGFNPAVPLLRYRTGDHASLERRGRRVVLAGLQGRAPVPFASSDGRALNTIDVTVALTTFPIARFAVHQRADHSVDVRVDPAGAVDSTEVQRAMERLFGSVPIEVGALDGDPERPAFSSEVALA